MEHKKIIKRRYDETAKFYDRRYREIQNIKYELIFEKISIDNEQNILDVGCGTGNLFLFLDNVDCFKFGIDLSIKSLTRCLEKLGRKTQIQTICADVDFLPFREDFFDIIFLITILQNVSDPVNSLKNIKKLCKPNGLILLSLLRKKFDKEQVLKLLSDAQIVPQNIIDVEKCEDIIVIIKN